MMNKTILATLLSASLLTACTGALPFQPSGVDAPSLWGRLKGEEANLVSDDKATIEQQWWKQFNDPVLNRLIADALANNKSLAIAKARVEEARANRTGAQSLLLPQISGSAGTSRQNQGFFTQDKPITLHEASIEANWELDLFGKNQARTGAARAIVQSEDANKQAVQVALLAEVARNYFDLRNFERQIEITQKNLDMQKRTLELTKIQFEGALASDFDVQRSAAQVSRTESLLPTLRIAFETTRNRINTLLGHIPGQKDELLKEKTELAPLDQRILIAAPATVLADRPDVRAAERRFAASISAHKAATRELFPTISLTSFFGVQDSSIMGASPWGIAGSLTQPILQFGRISSQIDAADAREQQAMLAYQQTVLNALEDMENALSNYLHETTRNASLTQAVTQNSHVVNLAQDQYTNGYISLLDVLVSERNLLDAESELAASDAKLRKDMVAIYTAAGGGWQAPVAEAEQAEPAATEPAPASPESNAPAEKQAEEKTES